MSDDLLREAEMGEDDPNDIDADTLDEVVDRIKVSYRADAEERLRRVKDEHERTFSVFAAEKQAEILRVETIERTTAEKIRRQDLAIEGRARTWASFVTRGLQWFIAAILIVGAIALIIGHPFHNDWLGIGFGVAVIVFVLLELIGILHHVSEWRTELEVKLRSRLRVWLIGE
jgi:hypothetical protein